MTKWKKFEEDFYVLVEAGYIAVNQGDEDSSLKLFRAAELLNPENSLSKVGFGYVHLHKLELKQACECFQQVLDKEPHNEMATAFLGLCMALSPNLTAKGETLLEKAAHSNDPLIKNLGSSALHFVEEYVKKAPTPMAAQEKTSSSKKPKHK
ncbi:MAG TPA: SctF chaperone SctG [Parachlamydiales bacterium]|nr:SctF chaperone SctG [Parachlamydiales bacterium]